MKLIRKHDFGGVGTSVLTDSQGLRSTLEEFQLEINYIDYGDNRINIHCGISEELDVLPEDSKALFLEFDTLKAILAVFRRRSPVSIDLVGKSRNPAVVRKPLSAPFFVPNLVPWRF